MSARPLGRAALDAGPVEAAPPAAATGGPAAAGSTAPWPVVWVASVAVFLVSLDSTMLFAAFGALRAAFVDVSAAELSWVLNAYTVVFAAMLVPAGGAADRWGRRRIFLAGVAVFLIGSAACGVAGSVEALIAARVLQAVGAALLTPASLAIVLAAFPVHRRAVAVSLWGAVGGLAAALGPSLGAFVVEHAGWPWAFYLNLPLGALAVWRGASILRESKRAEASARIDVVGMLLLIGAVGGLALGIVQADAPAWSRADVALALGLGAAALLGFVAWIRRVPAPLVEPALFRHRSYRAANLAMLAFGTAFAIMFFAVFFYLTAVWHYSLPQAGLAVTPGPLLVMPTALVAGRLAARHGHRALLTGGAAVFAASGLWFMLVPGDEPHYLRDWLPGLLMSGLGVGLTLSSLSAAAVARLPAEHYAVGSAVSQATRQIGSVLGVAITVLLVGHAGVQRADFALLYGVQVALGLLTAACCLAIDTRPRAPG